MSDYLPFVIIGLTTGSLYGLAGIGLVLTYRTSGIFNFAHGALAAAAAYVFYSFYVTWGWPWPLAAVTAILLFGVGAGVILEQLARRLAGARSATLVTGTVGLLLLIEGSLQLGYGTQRRPLPEFLPANQAFAVADVVVTWADVIRVGVGIAVFLGLFVYLRGARLGLAMRAVVDSPELLGLSRNDPLRARVVSWIIGCSVAALTGILIAPTLGLDAVLLTALVVQAFGAVAIGRFTSLPLTYAGGLGIGILASFATKEFAARPPFDGLPPVLPFLVLIVVMLVTPARKLPADAGRLSGKLSRPPRMSPLVRRMTTAAAAVALLFVPAVVDTRLPVYTTGLIFALLFLSLGLLTGLSGQISLAHAAFAGVGASLFSHLSVNTGLPWAVALLASGLLTAVVGALLALPAMRLSGIYLALATYGFGLLMDLMLFQTGIFFGDQNTIPGRRPSLGSWLSPDSDTGYYYVVLVVVACAASLIMFLRRARLGQYLRAMADSPTALKTLGLSVNLTRMVVFATSAFFAGLAGALYMGQIGHLSAVSFNSTYSLLYLAIFVVASVIPGLLVPSFLAAALLVVLPSYVTSVTLEVQSVIFGIVALGAAVVLEGQVDWSDLRRRATAAIDSAVCSGRTRQLRGPVAARMRDRSPVRTAGE